MRSFTSLNSFFSSVTLSKFILSLTMLIDLNLFLQISQKWSSCESKKLFILIYCEVCIADGDFTDMFIRLWSNCCFFSFRHCIFSFLFCLLLTFFTFFTLFITFVCLMSCFLFSSFYLKVSTKILNLLCVLTAGLIKVPFS